MEAGRKCGNLMGRQSAFSWLSAGLTETVTPKGRLKQGLHGLDPRNWILLDPVSASSQLRAKQRLFSSEHRRKVLDQTPSSIGPQMEVLEMLLEHLPRRYPDVYEIEGMPSDAQSFVQVSVDGYQARHRLRDYEHFPLEVVARIVQEDLVLLQDGHIVAGAVLFSFSRFHERFGKHLDELHKNVHQYERDLQKPVNRLFAKVSAERPMWRTNWNISWSDDLLAGYGRYPHRNPRISSEEREELIRQLKGNISSKGLAQSAWLKVEYQTVQRLRRHDDCILFTIRTFVDSFEHIKDHPAAAAMLLENLKRLERAEFRKYLGIDDEDIYEALRSYLHKSIS
eukprot:TRINITY_DN14958_c0_g1_i1.p1 TRINITY_DN14958_c0_g1~~TRINITY_DN14958_c0_g1_i1.p1  ORF type:complete len:339 (-),score=33.49 TRINITY_DN14958_c0_g1_i1:98-1114(-)